MSVTDDKTTPASFSAGAARRAIDLARQTLQIEADAILALKDRLRDDSAEPLARAVQAVLQCEGRAVVSGIGKSGHIGRKMAATLASTGTPALFMHPAEAAHGDLGMVTARDVFIAISNSGETAELLAIVPIIKRMGTVIIAMTGNDDSSLARLAAVHLNVGVAKEACTLNLAPTASTTATLAMGDALAVSLLDARGFVEEDFARSHPGGALGRRLLTHVRDVMRSGEAIPAVRPDVSLSAALMEITRKGMAMTAVVDEQFRPIGVFTDGDLRRLLERGTDFTRFRIADVMHAHPQTVQQDQLAVDAVQLMEQFRINQLLVTDADGVLTGALHIHDLTRAKVI
ncbi:sugar phosphate isomerase [Herbaspirillum sp. GW103]|uniref:KpsF/GutQ family sugar-phosphate isomerase n=1 Tax=unclassified Herbaspirillum TaxID=2624150 RepID=UPI00025E4C67|nr:MULTISPECIES: KpsF/GutQ family sugar-phosphate isomerase [unclassified Herbaspirillum]EIJ46321.1 sugar phosphate isomerase [Herbaspirillum sp. GW103]MCI1006000.1 KpsF/GutQ family sugar-phosphate isomerase [Herbaspirillum sp. C7C8]NUT62625.1 KpsF/GutQ family sugar-phosphate isomerase [Herbaspirillum sp. C9C3]